MTNGDRKLLAITLLPLVTLGVLFVAAGAKWRQGERKIRPRLVELFGAELVDAECPAAVDYASRTDESKTPELRELLYALEGLNDRYELMFNLLDRQSDATKSAWLPTDGEINTYLDEYIEKAQPLIERFRELEIDPSSVWLPHEHGNPQSWSRDDYLIRNFGDLLQQEFRAAVRSGQSARAVNAVKDTLRLKMTEDWDRDFMTDLADAMAVDCWSESDLEQLTDFLARLPALNTQWKKELRAGQFQKMEWLLHDRKPAGYSRESINIATAPSQRVSALDLSQTYESIRNPGSRNAVDQALKMENQFALEVEDSIDTAIQFPQYGQRKFIGGSIVRRAVAYTRMANQRRFTRTAVAIQQYHLKTGHYPESLNALSEVRLPRRQTLDPLGSPFLYEATENGYRLANASVWFPYYPGSAIFLGNRPDSLSTLLDRFHEVHFMVAADAAVTKD